MPTKKIISAIKRQRYRCRNDRDDCLPRKGQKNRRKAQKRKRKMPQSREERKIKAKRMNKRTEQEKKTSEKRTCVRIHVRVFLDRGRLMKFSHVSLIGVRTRHKLTYGLLINPNGAYLQDLCRLFSSIRVCSVLRPNYYCINHFWPTINNG